jgi:hypothetical protein
MRCTSFAGRALYHGGKGEGNQVEVLNLSENVGFALREVFDAMVAQARRKSC